MNVDCCFICIYQLLAPKYNNLSLGIKLFLINISEIIKRSPLNLPAVSLGCEVMQLTSSLNHRNEGRRPSPLLVAVQRG
jgi:hypothetical protein